MTNILFSNSSRKNCWGGVEKWVVTMAHSLLSRDYHTHIVCRPEGMLATRAQEINIPTHTASFSNSLDISTVFKILRLIRKLKIDLIICSTNLDIKLAGLAGKIAGIPVISRQGLALIPNSLKYKFLIRNFTSSIITNTYTIKKRYEEYGWFPPNFIHVIYNGVPPPHYQDRSQDLKQQLINSPTDKLILSAGRLNTQKGFTYLIETAKIAQDNKEAWHFIIAGNGAEKAKLLKLINKYNLKNIDLLGFKKSLHEYYLIADVFVLSSIAEGTPNVVLEAMSYKCPVIATNVNGVAEILENQKSGWIVPAKDSRAIYQALKDCLSNPENSKGIAEKAYQNVREKYTIEKTTNQFIEYINLIIAEHEKNHHKNA